MKNQSSTLYSALVMVGGTALLLATVIDVLAVIGRHTGIPLLGSIELVQVLVAVAGAMALLLAVLNDRHAMVRIVLSRLQGTSVVVVKRFNSLAMALFFFALACGSLWILFELWSSHEETELWQLPYRPLRLLIVLVLFITTGVVIRKSLQGGGK